MSTASQVLTGLVAALHVYFLVLEMFLWTTPFGRKTFARSAEEMEQTKVLTALKGVRGRASVDLKALEQLLVRFSWLVAEQPSIRDAAAQAYRILGGR